MKFTPTRIPDVVLIEPQIFADARGFFTEVWHARKFAAAGIEATFVQENHSSSRQGVLRGMHYQIRQPQGKLVRVASGQVFDVAVDMRRSSPYFGKWVGEWLSAANHRMLWIPPGFAHGFVVLSEHADFVYQCTDFYEPSAERTLCWHDSQVAIAWPPLPSGQPLVSDKDGAAPGLRDAETFP